MQNLGPRLDTVFNLIKPNSRVCDVGSDRGHLALNYLASNYGPFIQVVENKKGPFSILQNSLKDYDQDKRLLVSYADGLSKVDPQVDTVVISGMGGETIYKIIEAAQKQFEGVQNLILSPHTKYHLARQIAYKKGFKLSEEHFVSESGKAYIVMLFQKDVYNNYTNEELFYGTLLKPEERETNLFYQKHGKEISRAYEKWRSENGN